MSFAIHSVCTALPFCLTPVPERKALDLLLRMALIEIATGSTGHEYGYLLTTGSGVSDIVALNRRTGR